MATHKISNYTVGPSDNFFFDTNVWIFMFATIASSSKNKQAKYTSFFQEIISRDATIWINSQVVAEYVNRCLHLEFDKWKIQTNRINADFKKDFRPTDDYLSALEDVRTQVKLILEKSQKHPDDFNSINVEAILQSMGTAYDYGDAIIVDLCKRKKFKLVTDDSDMTKSNFSFPVITA